MSTKTSLQLDAEGRCLACNLVQEKRKRGLCEADYGRFRRRKDALPKEQREAFDQLCVDKGLILLDGRNVDDPFAAALSEFLSSTGDPIDTAVAEGIKALGVDKKGLNEPGKKRQRKPKK